MYFKRQLLLLASAVSMVLSGCTSIILPHDIGHIEVEIVRIDPMPKYTIIHARTIKPILSGNKGVIKYASPYNARCFRIGSALLLYPGHNSNLPTDQQGAYIVPNQPCR